MRSYTLPGGKPEDKRLDTYGIRPPASNGRVTFTFQGMDNIFNLEMHPSWWAARSSKPVRRRKGRRVSSILTHLRQFFSFPLLKSCSNPDNYFPRVLFVSTGKTRILVKPWFLHPGGVP